MILDFAKPFLIEHRAKMEAEGHDTRAGLIFCDTEGKFLRKSKCLRRSFEPACEKAGVAGLKFHELRHASASLLLLGNACCWGTWIYSIMPYMDSGNNYSWYRNFGAKNWVGVSITSTQTTFGDRYSMTANVPVTGFSYPWLCCASDSPWVPKSLGEGDVAKSNYLVSAGGRVTATWPWTATTSAMRSARSNARPQPNW